MELKRLTKEALSRMVVIKWNLNMLLKWKYKINGGHYQKQYCQVDGFCLDVLIIIHSVQCSSVTFYFFSEKIN